MNQRYVSAAISLLTLRGADRAHAQELPVPSAGSSASAQTDASRAGRTGWPLGGYDVAATLAAQHTTQDRVGRAEGLLRAGRALLYETVRALPDSWGWSDSLSESQRASIRLAAAQAAQLAADVVGSLVASPVVSRAWDLSGAAGSGSLNAGQADRSGIHRSGVDQRRRATTH